MYGVENCGFMIVYIMMGKHIEMLFFFQAEDGIRNHCVTGVQTCALPILGQSRSSNRRKSAIEVDQLNAWSGSA